MSRQLQLSAPSCELPLAVKGLTSYRAKGRYGWIMIGAKNNADAMVQALRSASAVTDLQIWDGTSYQNCTV